MVSIEMLQIMIMSYWRHKMQAHVGCLCPQPSKVQKRVIS